MESEPKKPTTWFTRIKKERAEIVAARLRKMEQRKKRKGPRGSSPEK